MNGCYSHYGCCGFSRDLSPIHVRGVYQQPSRTEQQITGFSNSSTIPRTILSLSLFPRKEDRTSKASRGTRFDYETSSMAFPAELSSDSILSQTLSGRVTQRYVYAEPLDYTDRSNADREDIYYWLRSHASLQRCIERSVRFYRKERGNFVCVASYSRVAHWSFMFFIWVEKSLPVTDKIQTFVSEMCIIAFVDWFYRWLSKLILSLLNIATHIILYPLHCAGISDYHLFHFEIVSLLLN